MTAIWRWCLNQYKLCKHRQIIQQDHKTENSHHCWIHLCLKSFTKVPYKKWFTSLLISVVLKSVKILTFFNTFLTVKKMWFTIEKQFKNYFFNTVKKVLKNVKILTLFNTIDFLVIQSWNSFVSTSPPWNPWLGSLAMGSPATIVLPPVNLSWQVLTCVVKRFRTICLLWGVLNLFRSNTHIWN